MTSLGEAEILIGSQRVGKFRALSLYAAPAVYPRLGIRIGCTLHDLGGRRLGTGPELVSLELRELLGDLRLTENADAIGPVFWAGQRRFVRSSSYGDESQIELFCDLDPWRLEQIEERRGGESPRFWLQLWPTITATGQATDAEIRAFPVTVPREQWHEFLARSGAGRYELLEIRYSAREADEFRRASQRLREAHELLENGEFDDAVGRCRMAIDALGHEVPLEGKDPIAALLIHATDKHRAEQYLGLRSKIKQLSSFAHHEFGTPVRYSRPEAQFVIRITESFIALRYRLF